MWIETFGVFAVRAGDAKPSSENGFKVELSKRCLVRTLTMATKTA